MEKPRLMVISGPTAAGKTAVALKVAKKVGGVIISADSMQIYKEMSVGTAKPTSEELDGADCRLIDFVEPDGDYDVYKFKRDAKREIQGVLSRGKVPIVCGGTGLYIKVLTENAELSAESRSDEVRKRLRAIAEKGGAAELHRQLSMVDKPSAERIHPNDIKRVIRALEIYETTGKTQTQWDAESEKEPKYSLYRALITCKSRQALYDRIDGRVDEMMKSGLLDEARAIYKKYDTTKISAIGYSELFAYFDGKTDLETAVSRIKQYSRNYAKRQLTWFRKEKYEKEYFTDETSAEDIAEDFVRDFNASAR